PSASSANLYYMQEHYGVLPSGTANPEIGFALLWYMGNFYDPPVPVDEWYSEKDPNYKNIPYHKRYYGMLSNLFENANQIVLPDPYKGVPNLEALYKEMCPQIFKDGMPLSQAMEEYIPRMQRALDALVMEAVPDPD
nr:hypothetical protein [bacterium]